MTYFENDNIKDLTSSIHSFCKCNILSNSDVYAYLRRCGYGDVSSICDSLFLSCGNIRFSSIKDNGNDIITFMINNKLFSLIAKAFYHDQSSCLTLYLIDMSVYDFELRNYGFGTILLNFVEWLFFYVVEQKYKTNLSNFLIVLTKYKSIPFQLKRGFQFTYISDVADKLAFYKTIELIVCMNDFFSFYHVNLVGLYTKTDVSIHDILSGWIFSFYDDIIKRHQTNFDSIICYHIKDLYRDRLGCEDVDKLIKMCYVDVCRRLCDYVLWNSGVLRDLQSLFLLTKTVDLSLLGENVYHERS